MKRHRLKQEQQATRSMFGAGTFVSGAALTAQSTLSSSMKALPLNVHKHSGNAAQSPPLRPIQDISSYALDGKLDDVDPVEAVKAVHAVEAMNAAAKNNPHSPMEMRPLSPIENVQSPSATTVTMNNAVCCTLK